MPQSAASAMLAEHPPPVVALEGREMGLAGATGHADATGHVGKDQKRLPEHSARLPVGRVQKQVVVEWRFGCISLMLGELEN